MNPDRAAGEFIAVADEIVVPRPHPAGVGIEQGYILVAGRGKGMVHRIPAIALLVPFHQGKIPDECEDHEVGISQPQPIRHLQAQLAEDAVDHFNLVSDEE
ncbi:MAG: hypothetical protein DDT26_02734 [Dehalococcoidia bacterium]|nr:hypothetical protein [Chloroflexota bacterium]